MSGNIRLHPEKGVNPRIGYCIRCGKDHSVILLGMWDRSFECSACGVMTIGARVAKCERCKSKNGTLKPIYEYERLPAGLCTECEKETKEHAAVVAAGGIYWQCEDCKQSGVIRPSDWTRMVRERAEVLTGPLGVTFTKAEGCPACGE